MPLLFGFSLEKSTTTGTGNFTLDAETGFRRLSDAAGTGAPTDVFWYGIRHETASPVEFEEGTGHMSDANTLVRDTVQRSSNSDALVDFSAGDKTIVIDATSLRQDREIEVIGTPVQDDVAQFNGTIWVPVAHDTLTAFTEIFVSTDQTITPEGSLTLTHGLNTPPILEFVVLKNTTSEFNYSIGDTVPANLAAGASANNQGVSIVADGTDLNVIYGSGSAGGTPVFSVINRQAGVSFANTVSITNSSWDAIFIAVAYGA